MMAEQKGKLEQEKTERPMTLIQKTIIIGFVGGVFWSLIGYLSYFSISVKSVRTCFSSRGLPGTGNMGKPAIMRPSC
ncbi:hypothetical protein BRO54_2881 [Geobacillus proteiniphilus]|uniref:Uncharacterized protein n=1 Tax=Geobacillus proteiniphilus TaxID=860353 RepID=A0A1Q5ST64_9BACL|nr:hypothetical protein BRO54_2881 [Geobacillus proteiniphilus]